MRQPPDTDIRLANVADVAALAPLFDAYRVFYGKPSDIAVARGFLTDRFHNDQSVIFIAIRSDGIAVAFTQLYPSFSSVSAAPTFILNDLFVAPEARRSGVAVKLLDAAKTYAAAIGAIRLSLSTAIDNDAAQALYASQGWRRDTQFYTFTLPL